MKDILLTLSVIWCTQVSAANCSAWEIRGVGSPIRVDGHRAGYSDMREARQRTIAYITRLQNTIDNCRLNDWQHANLLEIMAVEAERFNAELKTFRLRESAVANISR
ncbi:MAG: hypothetical protein CMN84_08175 [Spongiibacteraceae bacterium]|jgi:hypothetical protein|nr:hypothetical protein [Spongiibacteraceae bacterium]|tara:strand:+ start:347 stop:667 length:321 start_codon:yes stop_codon:yes gene_type:complete